MSANDAATQPVISLLSGQVPPPDHVVRVRRATKTMMPMMGAIAAAEGVPALIDALMTITTQLLLGAVGEPETLAVFDRVRGGIPAVASAMGALEGRA